MFSSEQAENKLRVIQQLRKLLHDYNEAPYKGFNDENRDADKIRAEYREKLREFINSLTYRNLQHDTDVQAEFSAVDQALGLSDENLDEFVDSELACAAKAQNESESDTHSVGEVKSVSTVRIDSRPSSPRQSVSFSAPTDSPPLPGTPRTSLSPSSLKRRVAYSLPSPNLRRKSVSPEAKPFTTKNKAIGIAKIIFGAIGLLAAAAAIAIGATALILGFPALFSGIGTVAGAATIGIGAGLIAVGVALGSACVYGIYDGVREIKNANQFNKDQNQLGAHTQFDELIKPNGDVENTFKQDPRFKIIRDSRNQIKVVFEEGGVVRTKNMESIQSAVDLIHKCHRSKIAHNVTTNEGHAVYNVYGKVITLAVGMNTRNTIPASLALSGTSFFEILSSDKLYEDRLKKIASSTSIAHSGLSLSSSSSEDDKRKDNKKVSDKSLTDNKPKLDERNKPLFQLDSIDGSGGPTLRK